jgi:thiol-disulfide isomerase/thioredoxin
MSVIGKNGKPTVVDFWAPWCESCKLAAPTLYKVEEIYRDRVNFVMINGDLPQAWPYIEAFRVDAIPHLALVNADGDVETALIGPIPKSVLEADIDTMILNQKTKTNTPLPYKMLDVFADVPENRRVHFDP